MEIFEDIISNTINYEQFGPILPTGVYNRRCSDCSEFLIIYLLNKCMALKKILDEMGKSPHADSELDKLYCMQSTVNVS
jgi:hypothetical protein